VDLSIGVVDIGGGQRTVFAMLAAEELGVGIDDINVIYGDTKGTRYAPSCHASRVTPEMGPPVLQAAAKAKQKLFQIASAILEVKAEDLRSKNGRIYLKSDLSRAIPFKSVCSRIDPTQPIEGRGSRCPNPDNPMFSTFGAQAVEVEVDEKTGQVRIVRVVSAQDFGTAINPKFCTSQIYGGVVFGMGYALSEEGIYDPKTGKLLNRNFCHYGMPNVIDFPPVEALIVEGEDPYFAYSAKGAAENTNAPTPAAIVNAIYNASGIWINDLPVTPDKVLKAIRDRDREVR
jgi:CO/xanthine dehydrogenase Mo-binding subunit